MIKLDNFSSFFVANWKLNGNFQFIDQFISKLHIPKDKSKCIVICPTSIHLDYVSQNKNGFYVGAQNVSHHKDGAFTGEISADSLSDFNVNFCIVGHSERRQIFNDFVLLTLYLSLEMHFLHVVMFLDGSPPVV